MPLYTTIPCCHSYYCSYCCFLFRKNGAGMWGSTPYDNAIRGCIIEQCVGSVASSIPTIYLILRKENYVLVNFVHTDCICSFQLIMESIVNPKSMTDKGWCVPFVLKIISCVLFIFSKRPFVSSHSWVI